MSKYYMSQYYTSKVLEDKAYPKACKLQRMHGCIWNCSPGLIYLKYIYISSVVFRTAFLNKKRKRMIVWGRCGSKHGAGGGRGCLHRVE